MSHIIKTAKIKTVILLVQHIAIESIRRLFVTMTSFESLRSLLPQRTITQTFFRVTRFLCLCLLSLFILFSPVQ